VLAAVGCVRLLRLRPWLGRAVVGASLVQFFLVASVPQFGGDWCWGPRLLLPLVTLSAVGLPFVGATVRRTAKVGLVAVGVLVQLLGLSLDHHRFFYERGLHDQFWRGGADRYYVESQLLARPAEIAVTLRDGIPPEASRLIPNPYPAHLVTNTVRGDERYRQLDAPRWMRSFRILYLPRPWPLWMGTLEPGRRPVNLPATTALLLGALAAGVALLRSGLRRQREPSA
jgi:hypothetical protein